MEKVSKTSERLGANMDLKTSNIISGKDVCFIRIYLFIRKEYPTGKHTSTTKSSKTDLKLFTRRFIHCFPMCEITLQIKERPYSSPGFWEHPNLTDESRSRAVDDIRCHPVAITTHYNIIDDCGSINSNTNHNKSHSMTEEVKYNLDHRVLSSQGYKQ